MLKSMIAIAAVALSAASVSAATVQVVDLGYANAPTNVLNPTAVINPVVYENVTGSVDGLRRSPFQPNATFSFPAGTEDTAKYTSVSANASATYSFTGLQKSLHLAWGSPDSYNELYFYSGASLLATITGTAIQAFSSNDAGLQSGQPNGLAYVKLSLLDGLSPVFFDKLVFKSPGANAFEFAALKATPVPLPLGVVFALTAVAGFGLMRRRTATA
jgi:hypothetical protein